MLRTDRASFSSRRHVDQHAPCRSTPRRLEQLDGRLRLDLARPRARRRRSTWPSCSFCASAARSAPRSTFFGSVIVVAARLRPEHRAALAPQRVADLADARAAGALLPPRLLAAAADERAVLRRVRAPPLRRVRVHDRFPDQIGRSRARRTPRRCTSTRADLLVLRCYDVESAIGLLLALLRLLDLRDLDRAWPSRPCARST